MEEKETFIMIDENGNEKEAEIIKNMSYML